MASLRRIIGIVVLVLGLIVIALAFAVLNSSSNTVPAQSTGSVAEITPTILGGGSMAISWSGAASGAAVTMYSCPDSNSCANAPYSTDQLTVVGSGSGASGSFSASVTGGRTYILTETGDSNGVAVTAKTTGISVVGIVGIVIAILGAILAILPSRARAAAPEAAEPEPTHDTPDTADRSNPQGEYVMAAAPAPPAVDAAGPGNRPVLKCASCGTLNEPWLTNCRWCKRTLTTTGA
jgi:hypothetical protein